MKRMPIFGRKTLQRSVIILILLLTGAIAASKSFADGIVFPPLVVQHLPDMPQQRALVVYRDGVETLLVESSFKGEGNEMAWIVPTPAQPTEIAKGSAGVLNTLELALQPQVIDNMNRSILVALCLLAWGLYLLTSGRFVPLRSLLMAVLLYVMITMGLSMSAALRGIDGPRQVAGVSAGDIKVVGSYDVQVVEAESSGRLDEWLSQNGFHPIPKEGLGVVDDYIAKGWKFVVARLRREGSGFTRPHPLTISFSVAAPVYPMRLTQLAGSNLHLDLFVVSDRRAVVDGMATVYSDEFDYCKDDYSPGYVKGRQFRAGIGLPFLVGIMKERCVLTWLVDDLSNKQLAEDFAIRFMNSEPIRLTVYTQRGAILTAVHRAAFVGGILLVLGALWHGWRSRSGRRPVLAFFVVMVAISGAAGSGVWKYSVLPQATFLEESDSTESDMGVDDKVDEIIKTLQAYPNTLYKMNVEELTQYFRDALEGQHNRYTGEPYTFEEQPGDLIITQDKYGIVARVFGGAGFYPPIGQPRDIRITGTEPSR